MKSKTKVIIFIFMILVLLIITICIKSILTEKHNCTIISIENDVIIVKENIIDKKYMFSAYNVKIKNEKGIKIDKTDLKVGDVICITSIKEKIKTDLAYEIEPINNVKLVQLVEERY